MTDPGVSSACPSCGAAVRDRPARHAVLACVALLVFWPTGIPAVVSAFGVDPACLAGDRRLARSLSRKAFAWGWASVLLAAGSVALSVVVVGWGVSAVSNALPAALNSAMAGVLPSGSAGGSDVLSLLSGASGSGGLGGVLSGGSNAGGSTAGGGSAGDLAAQLGLPPGLLEELDRSTGGPPSELSPSLPEEQAADAAAKSVASAAVALVDRIADGGQAAAWDAAAVTGVLPGGVSLSSAGLAAVARGPGLAEFTITLVSPAGCTGVVRPGSNGVPSVLAGVSCR